MMMNPSPMQATIALGSSQRRLRAALWTVQVLLATAFFFAAVAKLAMPLSELVASMAWVGAVPPGIVRFIGLSELAGAVGLVLPAALRIRPRVTGYAAEGLAMVMVLATLFHLARAEYSALFVTIGLGSLAAFVAWGRLIKAPVEPRPPLHV